MSSKIQESVVLTQPKLEQRKKMFTIGIRKKIPSKTIASTIPKLMNQTKKWLLDHQVSSWGKPFFRFYMINMGTEYDLEVGYLISNPIAGDETVKGNEIPAGTYGVLQYKGKNRGYQGNKALIEWAKALHIEWDRWDSPDGDNFQCRYEVYLSNIENEPDHRNWVKEVCIKVKE